MKRCQNGKYDVVNIINNKDTKTCEKSGFPLGKVISYFIVFMDFCLFYYFSWHSCFDTCFDNLKSHMVLQVFKFFTN